MLHQPRGQREHGSGGTVIPPTLTWMPIVPDSDPFHGHARVSILFPALVLVALSLPGAAHAGTVTAPSGGTHSATTPLMVQWNGIGMANGVAAPVNIELTVVGLTGGVISVPMGQNIANTGQHVIASASFRSLICGGTLSTAMAFSQASPFGVAAPIPISQMAFHAVVRNANNNGDYAMGPAFKMKCPPNVSTTTLHRDEIGSPSMRRDTRAAGWARVQKIVVNKTGGAVAMPPSFSIGGFCSGGTGGMGGLGSSLVGMTVVPGAGLWQSFGASHESSCSAFEVPPAPIPNVRACKGRNASWTVSVLPAQVSRGSGSTDITVTNTLACDQAAATGSLTIIKQVVSEAAIPPPDINFLIDVACTPGGPATTVKLNGGNGYRETIGGIAIDSNCTIAEQTPELPPDLARRGCRWETRYPDDQRVPITGREPAKLTVVNRWLCK